MNSERKCILKSLSNHIEIELPHSKQVFVGRGPETEIIDTKLSKCQVSLVADVLARTVAVQCLGGNPSVVDGLLMKKGTKAKLKQSSRLELLEGKHVFQVYFSPSASPSDNRLDKKGDVQMKTTEASVKNASRIEEHDQDCELPSKKMKLDNGSELSCSGSDNESVWESVDQNRLLIYSMKGLRNSKKIAAYDLDGTVIKTKSGKVFPVNIEDWTLFDPVVKTKFKQLFDKGHKIVIFTNQANISRGKMKVSDFKYKVERIARALDVPVQVFVATSEDEYRKPLPGMWNVLAQKKNGGVACDLAECFFVGDAASRVKDWAPKRKADFSGADRLFALNVGLRFATPDSHFLGLPEGKYALPAFQPHQALLAAPSTPPTDKPIVATTKEVIVMVGSQGSGKSYFAKHYLVKERGYECVNRDTLGSWQKCVSSMQAALRQGRSVVVDNTNPDVETRRRYIDVAAQQKCPCRCFLMNVSKEHAMHNNKFRQLIGDEHVPVTDVMIKVYVKKFVPPKMEEGFSDIVNVNFVPKFDDPEREKLYRLYLLER